MKPGYQSFAARFRGSDVRGFVKEPNQLVLSLQDGPVWPDRGNSFWVCWLDGRWYVGTWAPRYYRVQDADRLLDFCDKFDHFGDSAQGEIPGNLMAEYGLEEVPDDAFDALWEANRTSE